MIQPSILEFPTKKLVGISLSMSVQNNKTGELWRSFMPNRNQISNRIGTDLYSLQIYPSNYFRAFSPSTNFEKWALADVEDHNDIPAGMHAFDLQGGLYACFHYQGPSTDKRIYQYIFAEWLPQSKYMLEQRPHFEVLGSRYSNTSPDSEEDIYIPIRLKG